MPFTPMTTSDANSREAVGFLCRWCLLLLVAAGAAGGIWSGVVAAAEANRELSAGLLMPDLISRPGMQVNLAGVAPTGALHERAAMLLSVPEHGPVTLATAHGGLVLARAAHVRPGVNRFLMRGTPYGTLAFCRYEAMILGADVARGLHLVDARMLNLASAGQIETLRDCLGELRRHGGVGFFHPGPIQRSAVLRDAVRRIDPDLPVVFALKPGAEPMEALRLISWAWTRGNPKPAVVTADAELAALAARQGFAVHLVGPLTALPAHSRIIRHESLAKLKESLHSMPIGR